MALTSIPGVADAYPGNVVTGLGADPYNGDSGDSVATRTTQLVALALTSSQAASRTTQVVSLALTASSAPTRTSQLVALVLTHNPPPDTCPTPPTMDDLCTATGLIMWAGVVWADGTLGEDYAELDRAHPNSYFGGFKEARLLGVSECARALSSHDGEYQLGRFAFVLSDTDRAIRAKLVDVTNRHFFNRAAIVRAVSPAGEAAAVEPRVLGHGFVSDYRFDAQGFDVTVTCRDSMTSTLGHFRSEGTFPLRTITAADFPTCPAETIGKAVPVAYGLLSDETAATPVGVIAPIYVGTVVVASQTWRILLLCGHAVKRVVSWRYTLSGSATEVSQGEGTDFLVPGYAGWTANVGPSPYVDINGRRYCYILARGPKGDAIVDGSATFGVNVEGAETLGNGAGELLRDHFDQMKHFFNQWIATPGGYQAGTWAANPRWDSTTCKVNNASFDLAKTIKQGQVAGGYVGGGMYLGAEGALETMRAVLQKWCLSGDCRIGQNDYWQIVCIVLDTAMATASLPRVTDVLDIYAGSFEPTPLVSDIANALPYRYGPRYGAQAGDATWEATDEAADAGTQTYYGRLPADDVELHGVRTSAVAANIMERRLRRTKHPPVVRTVEGSLCLDAHDLGDVIRVTHHRGLGASGDVDVPSMVVRKTIVPDTLRVRLDLEDVTDQLDPGD